MAIVFVEVVLADGVARRLVRRERNAVGRHEGKRGVKLAELQGAGATEEIVIRHPELIGSADEPAVDHVLLDVVRKVIADEAAGKKPEVVGM